MSRIRPRTMWSATAMTIASATALIPAGTALAAAGTPAAAGTYTHTARLTIGDESNGRACSAVLVDESWVLSAVSCFAKTPGASVAAGKPELKATARIGTTTLDVVSIVPRGDRDVVLARLSAPVTGIAPIKLAAAQPAVNAAVSAAGFGRTKTEWVQDKVHTAAFGVSSADATTLALTAKGTDAICQGDAGGPLVNGKGELAGINSRSWQGGCLGTPAGETRTNAIAARADDLRGWMQQEILPQTPGWKTQALVQSGSGLYQATRGNDGSWTGFNDVQSRTGAVPGGLRNSAAVGMNGDTHVLAVSNDSKLFHTIRKQDGTWATFGNVFEVAGTLGNLTSVTATNIGWDLHVVAVADGKALHTVRNATGHWTPFKDITTGKVANVTGAATAVVRGELQVTTLSGGKAYHTIRQTNGNWLNWGDVAGAAGATGPITSLSTIGAGDETHIVIATDNGTRQYHAVRNFNGTWSPLTEIKSILGTVTAKSVATANIAGEVQVAVTTADGKLLHTTRHTDRTWAPATTVPTPGLPGAPGHLALTGTWNG
ncbi:trypsin-like serine protease [Streptomyces sp. NPDC057939]|uniref:trypsin-like serine protease n=1 Tax=Streptomyces sp. NPDC057939 TaxID=3346284 RepID=UPI0036EDC9F0